jgi:hypothetical protein
VLKKWHIRPGKKNSFLKTKKIQKKWKTCPSDCLTGVLRCAILYDCIGIVMMRDLCGFETWKKAAKPRHDNRTGQNKGV